MKQSNKVQGALQLPVCTTHVNELPNKTFKCWVKSIQKSYTFKWHTVSLNIFDCCVSTITLG